MYKIGKISDMTHIKGKIPATVYQEVLRIVTILDKYYGKDRDIYKNDGGFVFIAENKTDLNYFIENHIDPRKGSYEDIGIIKAENVQYFNIVFLCNNEFSINLISLVNLMPELRANI